MRKSKLELKSIESKDKLNSFLQKVKEEMLLNNIYYKKAKFACYADSIATYQYKNHSALYEFNIICDDILLDKLTIKELLELKRIEYFNQAIYLLNPAEQIANETYNGIENNVSSSLN